MSAYAARGGLDAYVFMPEDAPSVMKAECTAYGAKVYLVQGLINDAGKVGKMGCEARGWFDVSTLKEPYRAKGKKTMGLELAEQLGWRVPDAIIYPTGGGTGIVGMWKAFAELEEMCLIGSKRPKMIVVQAEGCAPIVRAFEERKRHAELWQAPRPSRPAFGCRWQPGTISFSTRCVRVAVPASPSPTMPSCRVCANWPRAKASSLRRRSERSWLPPRSCEPTAS